jgi:hypothetical protein
MVQLQNDVAQIYGPNFSVTDHIAKYHQRDAFVKNLPKTYSDPDYEFFEKRDITISEIRALLKEVGLTDW